MSHRGKNQTLPLLITKDEQQLLVQPMVAQAGTHAVQVTELLWWEGIQGLAFSSTRCETPAELDPCLNSFTLDHSFREVRYHLKDKIYIRSNGRQLHW